jgi:hypothetical protein
MAEVTNAFTTYDAQANREDLSDIIYNIDPFDTPMMTAAGRRNVSNILYDWQTENLPVVDTTADLEGFELARAAGTPTVRQSGVAQINHRDATVSGTQDAANPAGKRQEMAHQIALDGKALKRDCETVMFGTIQDETLGDATTARTTFPLANWLITNLDEAGDATTAIPSTKTPRVAGTPRALTEDIFNDVLQSCYENGAEPTLYFVGPYNKRVVSTFDGRTSARQMIAFNRVVNSVTVYASDFGTIKILPTRWIDQVVQGPPTIGYSYIMDPAYYRVAFYRNFQRSMLGKLGDADTEMIVTEYGLQVDNEAAHGGIFDLTLAA